MSSSVTEKPPRHGHNKTHASSPSRTRKVNRQQPVPKRRQSSPGRLKRDRSSVRIDSSDSETENETVHNSRVNGVDNNNRPSTLPLRSRSDVGDEKQPSKKSTNSFTNRNMESSRSFDQFCPCPRGKCICRVRRNTKVLTPGISPAEVMEKETKLIVLEYLSSLSGEELTARNKTSRQDSFASTSQEDFTRGRKSVKANTVTLGENERKQILEMLAKQNAEEQLKNGKKLGRSASDVSDQQYEKMRRKFREMQIPIKKWMTQNLRQEITGFDKTNLKPSPRKMNRQVSQKSKAAAARAAMSPLRVKIPRGSIVNQQIETNMQQRDSLMTPHTFVANGLEAISEEILIDYPDLLDKPITDLLLPLSDNKSISYEVFKSVAKSVFDLQLSRVTPTVWSRIALTLYMVKETMFLGNLNDMQLELMVDYSTRFLTVNASEQVEEEGGWDSLEAETEEFFLAGAYDAISSDDDSPEKIERKISRQHIYHNASFREKVSQTVAEWSPIGMAAMLVALGIGYSYLRT